MNDLAVFLADVERFYKRYVVFPSEHESCAVTLWTAHAWLVDRFDVSPILAVTSAEMRSGKTRVLDCAELLVPNPRRMVLPSEAVFYTVVAQRPRTTILLDEVDAIFGPRPTERTEGIRAVLNSGNRQGTPVLRVRLDGRRREVEELDVFGPKIVAGIGDLPATVADRSITIRMRRRALNEPAARFRDRRARAEASAITLPDWDSVPLVPDVPDVPEAMSDRAADGWEPLLAIADAAGDQWPARARSAAVSLSSDEAAPTSIGIRLLADIKDVMGKKDYLTTRALLDLLHGIEAAPWSEWYGSPLTARELAKLLLPYRIAPVQRRIPHTQGDPVRAYWSQDFKDAWNRYVPKNRYNRYNRYRERDTTASRCRSRAPTTRSTPPTTTRYPPDGRRHDPPRRPRPHPRSRRLPPGQRRPLRG